MLTYVGVLIVVVLGVLWGMSFHFVRTKRLNVREWFRNSLGLPRGSVRAIIAIAFISTLICSALLGEEILELPDWAIGVTGSVVGFYFGAATNRRDTKEEKTHSNSETEHQTP